MVKKVLIYDDPLLVRSIGRGLQRDLGVDSEGVLGRQALELLASNQYSAFILDPIEVDLSPWMMPIQHRAAYQLMVKAHEQQIPTVVLSTSIPHEESKWYSPFVVGQLIKPASTFELSMLLYNHGISNFSSAEEEAKAAARLRDLQPRYSSNIELGADS